MHGSFIFIFFACSVFNASENTNKVHVNTRGFGNPKLLVKLCWNMILWRELWDLQIKTVLLFFSKAVIGVNTLKILLCLAFNKQSISWGVDELVECSSSMCNTEFKLQHCINWVVVRIYRPGPQEMRQKDQDVQGHPHLALLSNITKWPQSSACTIGNSRAGRERTSVGEAWRTNAVKFPP